MLLFAITGAMLIAAATDLLLLFLGLELLVLPGYMLAGYAKRDGLSTEGAIKYFLLGSFAPPSSCSAWRSSGASPARPASTAWPTRSRRSWPGRRRSRRAWPWASRS